MSGPQMSIAQAIGELRGEILDAMRQGSDADVRFHVEEVELNLQVEVATSGNLGGSVGLWSVATVEAGVDRAHTRTHQIRIVLRPRIPQKPGQAAGDVWVGDDDTSWQVGPQRGVGSEPGSR